MITREDDEIIAIRKLGKRGSSAYRTEALPWVGYADDISIVKGCVLALGNTFPM